MLSTIPLQDASSGGQKKVTESTKICWLLAKYSIETLAKVCQSISSLPIGRTELQQQHNTIAEQGGITTADATFLQEFVKEQCPSLLWVIASNPKKKMSSPLCLVHLHRYAMRVVVTLLVSTSARYTMLGVRKASKITLSCVNCELLYNYAQFGNKHKLGFWYLMHTELLRLEIQHLPAWTPGVSELSGVSYTAVSWLLAGCTRKA